MASALLTVEDYINEARVLLQDTVVTYRYSDSELLSGLNIGLQRARKMRADLFIGAQDDIPYYAAVSASEVAMDVQYRSALLFHIIGHAQLRDEEETTDQRAAALLSSFSTQLTGAS